MLGILSIKSKLIIMVIISVSITLMLSYVVLTGLSDMNQQVKKIIDEDVKRKVLALEIIADLSNMQLAEKNLILAVTQDDMGTSQQNFVYAKEKILDASAELKPLIHNGFEGNYAQFIQFIDSYIKVFGQIAHFARQDTHAKAIELSNTEARQLVDKARAILKEIVADSIKDMQSAKINTEDQYQSIRAVSLSVLITDIIISILLAALIIVQLTRSINKFKQKLLDIEENKDLTQTYSVNGPEEIIIMDTSFNRLMKSLRKLVDNVKQGSAANSATAEELSATSQSVGNNVELSVGIIDQTSHQASLINKEIISSIQSAQSSKSEIEQANNTLQDARDDIIVLTDRVQHAVETETRLANDINRLATEALEVKKVLEVISNIAEQTNLLALNAAIEAARAGEQGRGFAVVADEVRNLAAHTQNSLNDINATITSIINSIEDVSKDMNLNTQDIQKLSVIANDVDEKINNTVLTVSNATEASDKTVSDFEHTGHEIGTIVEKIQEVNKLSAENARSVEEIGSSAEFLNSMTEKLNVQLNVFKT